ncbi:uncharacterized protein METZ01_LOCUS312674, partial [marine metagenome]
NAETSTARCRQCRSSRSPNRRRPTLATINPPSTPCGGSSVRTVLSSGRTGLSATGPPNFPPSSPSSVTMWKPWDRRQRRNSGTPTATRPTASPPA